MPLSAQKSEIQCRHSRACADHHKVQRTADILHFPAVLVQIPYHHLVHQVRFHTHHGYSMPEFMRK